MALARKDIEALLRLLREEPALREEMRVAVGLPADPWNRLAEAQRRTEERLETLTARVDALAEAQRRTEERLQALIDHVAHLTDRVGWLIGDALERRYRERPDAYLGRIARRLRLIDRAELDDLLEAAEAAGKLTPAESNEVRLVDSVIRGRAPDGSEVYLVVEASWRVDARDVERAAGRAALLSRAGFPCIPVVAGEQVTEGAVQLAQQKGVWQVTDGRAEAPGAA
ncbi:MAG: hypothetical protein HY775_12935 [Acidobacteria bacterium]|nr:hypothetical protein [Acidobacteriota bacterium]